MQLSTDGTLRFIGKRTFKTKDGKDCYMVEFADDSGDSMQVFSTDQAYFGLGKCQFGDTFSGSFNAQQRFRGYSLTLIDVVV